MVQSSVVDEQLNRIGANARFWNKPELNELHKILLEGEQISHVVNGRYEGGFAILVSTNLRIILVDKKPFFLTIEDMRYERISDVELNHRLLDATLRLGAISKDLKFMGYNPSKMRALTSFIQERVMQTREGRQPESQTQTQPQTQTQFQPAPAPKATPQPSLATQAHASREQSEIIGQVAVTAMEEAEASSSEQFKQILAAQSENMANTGATHEINPYRSAPIFHHRVSRFY